MTNRPTFGPTNPQRLEMMLMTLAVSLLLVVDTGSLWLWMVPLFVALAMLALLTGHRPAH